MHQPPRLDQRKVFQRIREGGAPFMERLPDKLDCERAWNALKSSRYVG